MAHVVSSCEGCDFEPNSNSNSNSNSNPNPNPNPKSTLPRDTTTHPPVHR